MNPHTDAPASFESGELPIFSPLIEHAIELSAQWHDRTYRKSRWRDDPFDVPEGEALQVPVMAHLTAVAMTLQRAGWDEETVAAGFLHDIIEDRNVYGSSATYDWLCETIGKPVADRVLGVSERKKDGHGQWLRWRERKQEYIDNLARGTDETTAISLADKLHNLWTMNQAMERGIDIFTSSESRRALSAGPDEQRWFFRSVIEVAEAFEDPRLEPIMRQLLEEFRRFETRAARR